MRRGVAVPLSMLALLLTVMTVRAQEGPAWSGYVRNYTGVLTREEPDFSIIQNSLNLKLTHSKDRVGFTANPWVYHYPQGEIDFGLREAYLDLFLGPLDVRLGKQQIIWGKGEGVFITDIVSPKDMREFLLPDFEEIRIGINALKVNYYLGPHSLELAVVPQFVPTQPPDPGSLWDRRLSFPVPAVVDSSRMDIPLKVKNGEVFGRYSLMSSFADVELMGGYMWDDDPTMHVRRTVDPHTGTVSSLTVIPRHHRLSVGGAAFSTVLSDVVVRGEGAGYHGKFFRTSDPTDADGVVEKNYLHFLLGADYTLWDVNLSAQFIQQVILDYEESIEQRRFENMATFRANRKFLREVLTLELFSYVGLDEPDALVRPRVKYDVADGFEIQLGANLFFGDEGRFGAFDENDMVYLKTRYSF